MILKLLHHCQVLAVLTNSFGGLCYGFLVERLRVFSCIKNILTEGLNKNVFY